MRVDISWPQGFLIFSSNSCVPKKYKVQVAGAVANFDWMVLERYCYESLLGTRSWSLDIKGLSHVCEFLTSAIGCGGKGTFSANWCNNWVPMEVRHTNLNSMSQCLLSLWDTTLPFHFLLRIVRGWADFLTKFQFCILINIVEQRNLGFFHSTAMRSDTLMEN